MSDVFAIKYIIVCYLSTIIYLIINLQIRVFVYFLFYIKVKTKTAPITRTVCESNLFDRIIVTHLPEYTVIMTCFNAIFLFPSRYSKSMFINRFLRESFYETLVSPTELHSFPNVGCRYLPRQPRTIRSRSAETVALKRAIFFLSGQAAGCTPGGARCVAASWLSFCPAEQRAIHRGELTA
jgi:hypothetical protein